MLYKTLGFAVWKVGRWFLGRKLPSRKAFAAGGAGLLLAGAAAAGAKREISA
jgi:hypothetical protein